ncbi:potassium channel family protein [Virgibacillus halophilus]|uniref:Potassium channel family protein n=1 Tax=Tigheibacillus halophilus TaxID=361280 RepID=A0ABU5C8J9_9BACI|nr:potassium channel family protein [Virgibacillus halophilus]
MKKKIQLIYEITLVVLALISVIFIWSSNQKIIYLDKMIWLVFFIDVLVRLIMAKNKWKFIKENPFDIIAALPLDSIFQTARIVRLFRVLRFFSIGKKYLTPVKNILATNGLGKLLTVSAGILIAATVLVTHFEPNIDTYADGLYWAVVTTTTVGYGDLSPVTGVGRIIAIVLMLVGIGIIGMLTGSLTTYFVKDKTEKNPTVTFIQSELDRYDELTWQEKKRLEILLQELNKEKG